MTEARYRKIADEAFEKAQNQTPERALRSEKAINRKLKNALSRTVGLQRYQQSKVGTGTTKLMRRIRGNAILQAKTIAQRYMAQAEGYRRSEEQPLPFEVKQNSILAGVYGNKGTGSLGG